MKLPLSWPRRRCQWRSDICPRASCSVLLPPSPLRLSLPFSLLSLWLSLSKTPGPEPASGVTAWGKAGPMAAGHLSILTYSHIIFASESKTWGFPPLLRKMSLNAATLKVLSPHPHPHCLLLFRTLVTRLRTLQCYKRLKGTWWEVDAVDVVPGTRCQGRGRTPCLWSIWKKQKNSVYLVIGTLWKPFSNGTQIGMPVEEFPLLEFILPAMILQSYDQELVLFPLGFGISLTVCMYFACEKLGGFSQSSMSQTYPDFTKFLLPLFGHSYQKCFTFSVFLGSCDVCWLRMNCFCKTEPLTTSLGSVGVPMTTQETGISKDYWY